MCGAGYDIKNHTKLDHRIGTLKDFNRLQHAVHETRYYENSITCIIVQCTLYSVHCTVYIVQCTVLSVHC